MSGLDRTEVIRRDCPDCHGNGYKNVGGVESLCGMCGGAGVLEKEVPFKFDGKRSREETAELWEIPVDELSDKGHSAGD